MTTTPPQRRPVRKTPLWIVLAVAGGVFVACTSTSNRPSGDYEFPDTGPVAVSEAQAKKIQDICTDAVGVYMKNKFNIIGITVHYYAVPMTRQQRYNRATGFTSDLTVRYMDRARHMTCMMDEEYKMPSFSNR